MNDGYLGTPHISMQRADMYVFLDTNVYLHFRDFDQVDWPKTLGLESVCIVVAPITLAELDKFKYDQTSKRRKKRSRSITKRLNALIFSGSAGAAIEVRPGVTLLALTDSPELSAYPGLSAEVQDDHLIASALTLATSVGTANVAIVADDGGLLNKARARGLKAILVDQDLRLPDEPTEDEIRVRDLEKRIGQLEQPRRTTLELSLRGEAGLVSELAHERDTVMRYVPGDETEALGRFESAMGRTPVKAEEVEAVVDELNRGVMVRLALSNNGDVSTSNVVITVRVALPFVAREVPPQLPPDTWLGEGILGGGARSLRKEPIRLEHVALNEDSYEIVYKVDSLVHSVTEPLPPFFLVFPTDDSCGPCELAFRLVSDNSPAQGGSLFVALKNTAGTTQNYSYEELESFMDSL